MLIRNIFETKLFIDLQRSWIKSTLSYAAFMFSVFKLKAFFFTYEFQLISFNPLCNRSLHIILMPKVKLFNLYQGISNRFKIFLLFQRKFYLIPYYRLDFFLILIFFKVLKERINDFIINVT